MRHSPSLYLKASVALTAKPSAKAEPTNAPATSQKTLVSQVAVQKPRHPAY